MEDQQTQIKQKRTMPQSELDLSLMTTDSVWGKPEVNQELKNRLTKYFSTRNEKGEQLYDQEGNPIVTMESLWGLLGFYTRDLRLANLSAWNGEMDYCRYYLNLANDFLQAEMIEPFVICLSRVATVLELSQSKGGFLRRRINTFTQENVSKETEPPKKNLFGSGGKGKTDTRR